MAKKNFEESLAKLERITEELESGDLTLEESLKKFDEGVKLAEFCNHKLDEAQQKVNILLKKDDTFREKPVENESLPDKSES
ncbi:MAG: exodeoxyribonuclease VII small subunit [Desulfurivibrionaceae bacterium]